MMKFVCFVLLTVSVLVASVPECKDILPMWCEANRDNCGQTHTDIFKRFCRKTCGFCTPVTETPPTIPKGKTIPPYTGKCGQPEVKGIRVVGGKTPPRGAWPWQILLMNRGRGFCGGTLILPEWVVTAAHCVYHNEGTPSNFAVRVGEHNITKIEGSEEDVVVEKVVRHPDYLPSTLNNDIALLKLSRPVKLTKYVQPACFPSEDPPVGSQCYITGWGKTHHPGRMSKILQQGLLPVVSNKVCYEKNHHRIPISITAGMICGGSGGSERTQGCHGDSGGPFVCNVKGVWELHGSVSHGSPVCDSTETYTVFSRTNHYKAWIKLMMATH